MLTPPFVLVVMKTLPEEAALPPNKTLFVQNLPSDTPDDVVRTLFQQ